MPLQPKEFRKLATPWKELEPLGEGVSEELVDRLEREALAVAAWSSNEAAKSLVLAVGNCMMLSGPPRRTVERLNKLLATVDPRGPKSRRFG